MKHFLSPKKCQKNLAKSGGYISALVWVFPEADSEVKILV